MKIKFKTNNSKKTCIGNGLNSKVGSTPRNVKRKKPRGQGRR